MKENRKLLIAAPIVLVVLALIVLVWTGNGEAAETSSVNEEASTAPVRVTTLEEMTLPQRVSYTGTIEAWEQALITSPGGSRIEQIMVNEGDRVQRGQVLVRMENANLHQAEIQMTQARNDMERFERLVEVGSVARQQAEQARVQYETAAANVHMLQQNTNLRSPITGVVTDKYFVDGELYMPGAGAPSILTVMQTNPLKVVINVSERYYPHISQGMPAAVRLDTYGDRTFPGRVEKVLPTVSTDSRTFRVEVRLDNNEQMLSPGMFARTQLDLGEISGWFLPSASVHQSPGTDQHFVYVVEDGIALRRPVQVGERFEDYRQILSGLEDGDVIVNEGTGRLDDGGRVRIVE